MILNFFIISSLVKFYAALVFFCFFTNLSKAIIAAGVTPEILDAAPRVGGCVVVSFSMISFERLPTFL